MNPTPPPLPPSPPAPPPESPPVQRLSAAAAAVLAHSRAIGLARWEGEGGAGDPAGTGAAAPPLRAEPLRQRVIALENLVIALLATASEAQRDQALAMADFISPRPGHTAHALTLRAAGRMRSLLARSRRFRPAAPAAARRPA